MLLSTYSDNNDFLSETNGSIGAVIILHLNAFEQSVILTISVVICKASIEKSYKYGLCLSPQVGISQLITMSSYSHLVELGVL